MLSWLTSILRPASVVVQKRCTTSSMGIMKWRMKCEAAGEGASGGGYESRLRQQCGASHLRGPPVAHAGTRLTLGLLQVAEALLLEQGGAGKLHLACAGTRGHVPTRGRSEPVR